MTKQETKKRIAKLRKVINEHNYNYHVLDRPKISDAAFDSLKHELYQLEQEYPDLITPDSPSQRVSGQALDKFVKVKHKQRMLSLEDVFYQEELEAWQTRIQRFLGHRMSIDYFAEYKVDGFAISLIYQDGFFKQGVTRGDGQVGEDVTQNLKTIHSIPLKLFTGRKGRLEIRGEVYMTKQAFAAVNQERRKKGLPLYANPRNTAAGSIRQLNPKIAASRQLDFLAYDLVTDLGQKTHQEEHRLAAKLGFRVDQGKYCADLKEVIKFRQKIMAEREKLPFQIDGIVVNVNNNQLFSKLGTVGKAPRGAIAFKFPAKEAVTVVKDIVIQVGRTGALTPVANLKPIRIEGTLVSRATLHNQDEIDRLDVRLGDTVVVQRAGDVIPEVVKVIKKMRSGREKKFRMPERCPVCGSPVVRPEGEAVHRCTNKQCGAQQKKRLIHFVSKKGFDIDGLGPEIIDQLMDQGLISNPADIFSLERGDLIPLERFADKSADNLIKAIEKSKQISLPKFIYALGIRHVGEETAINLAKYFGQIDKLAKASQEILVGIPDIGQVVAESIFDWFSDKTNRQLIDKLAKSGIMISRLKKTGQKLAGLTFVFTGQLTKFSRQQARAKVRQLGGQVASAVSNETDFLVLGREAGSKYQAARKLKIKIIKEKEFLKIIQ